MISMPAKMNLLSLSSLNVLLVKLKHRLDLLLYCTYYFESTTSNASKKISGEPVKVEEIILSARNSVTSFQVV